MRMTPDDADGRLAYLAAAVEDAIPPALRQEWAQRICARARPRRPAGDLLRARPPVRLPAVVPLARPAHGDGRRPGTPASTSGPPRTSSARRSGVPTSSTSRTAGCCSSAARAPIWSATLPIPSRPDRLVIEINDGGDVDAAVARRDPTPARAGLPDRRPVLRQQREPAQLLPHADFVKIDVRDLDVEGPPVVHLARSYGAPPRRRVRRERRDAAARPRPRLHACSRETCSSAPACSTGPAHAVTS